MGFDELQPLSKHGVDGLGGLKAIVVCIGHCYDCGLEWYCQGCKIMDQGVAYQTKQEGTCCCIELLYLSFMSLRDMFETCS
jgi:hypothetical protein